MLAAGKGHVEVAQFLAQKGADLEIMTKQGYTSSPYIGGLRVDVEEEEEGRTALMFAAENGHDKVVELLVEQGADKVKCPLTYPLMAPSHILEYFRRTKPTSMVAPH